MKKWLALLFIITVIPFFVSGSASACPRCGLVWYGESQPLSEVLAPPPTSGLFGGSGQLGNFKIQLNPTAELASNPAALAAFERAAAQWEARIADDITVVINAGLGSLGGNILGQTLLSTVSTSYNNIRNAMIADSSNEIDEGIINFLPDNLTATLPSTYSLSNNISLTRANAKALGFVLNSNPDATITFNSDFSFDYDSSDGTGAGLIDFETVAAHEIGHVLGFISIVDSVDTALAAGQTNRSFSMTTFDLFRFQDGQTPSSAAEFESFNRHLVPGSDHVFDDLFQELRLSGGRQRGDGQQASHWKDNVRGGTPIGIMDPVYDRVFRVNNNDFRMLDLIGYEINSLQAVPEPGTGLLLLMGSVWLVRVRHGRRR